MTIDKIRALSLEYAKGNMAPSLAPDRRKYNNAKPKAVSAAGPKVEIIGGSRQCKRVRFK